MISSTLESAHADDRKLCKLSTAAFAAAGLTGPFVTLQLQFKSVWPLFALPVIPLIIGLLAMSRIGRSDHRLRGQSLAMTAIILSLVWLGSTLVLVYLGVHDGWLNAPN